MVYYLKNVYAFFANDLSDLTFEIIKSTKPIISGNKTITKSRLKLDSMNDL